MADFTIDSEEISEAIKRRLSDYKPSLAGEEVGRVLELGDGIARVSGLPSVAVNELLNFERGAVGLALNLDEDTIGAVLLGSANSVEEGEFVRSSGSILSVPVGNGLLGRVVNALGEPIDDKGPIDYELTRRLEVQAPGIVERQPVSEPMQTGIKAIDTMCPIGRGQRELIIGDRKTGKTSVALDTIIKGKVKKNKNKYLNKKKR